MLDLLHDDRGILTAQTIAGLPLQQLELVVLSACETGLGEVAGREGVFGVVSRLSYRACSSRAELMGVAHPGAAWLEWLGAGSWHDCGNG